MPADRFKARPTTYKGVQMRSRLEAGFAMWLDQHHMAWEYEPGAFANERGQYLPDFRITGMPCSWLAEPSTVYVEVKPADWPYFDKGMTDEGLDQWASLMRGMGTIWASEPDAVIILVRPRELAALDVSDLTPLECVTVGVLDPDAGPPGEDPLPWPTIALWSQGPDGSLALCRPVWGHDAPWPDGYWKAK